MSAATVIANNKRFKRYLLVLGIGPAVRSAVLGSVRSMKETGKACKRLAASIRSQVTSIHRAAEKEGVLGKEVSRKLSTKSDAKPPAHRARASKDIRFSLPHPTLPITTRTSSVRGSFHLL